MPARAHRPTDEQRRTVRAMAGFGVPHDDIALVVRCSPPTLRKHYRHELDVATIEANARVAQCLFQQATTPGNVAASIFWLKARAGWREKQVVEMTRAEPVDRIVLQWEDAPQHEVPSGQLIEGAKE